MPCIPKEKKKVFPHEPKNNNVKKLTKDESSFRSHPPPLVIRRLDRYAPPHRIWPRGGQSQNTLATLGGN
jgi:hypothetical protein